MSYKNKKYALILGRSVEGCGCSFCAHQLQTWCDKNGVDLQIYGYAGKKMSRTNSHNIRYTPYKIEDLDNLQKELNQKDVVIFFTYPYIKGGAEYVKAFYEKIIKGVNNPIRVGFIHEVHKTYIDKIPYMIPIFNSMDLIMGYGPTTFFNKACSEMFPSKKGRVKRMSLWFDLEDQAKFRNTNNNKKKQIMYLGRWTSTKEPHRLLFLSPYIKELDPDFKIVLKGIERSIGGKMDIYDNPYAIDMTDKKRGPKPNEKGMAEVYKEYIHDEAMEELSQIMFGCTFFHLDKHPEEYGDRAEYTCMEIINCGAIPILDIHWAKHNKINAIGQTYYDYNLEHPFMIVSDREKLRETAEEMMEIAKDENRQKEMIENGYKILQMEYDTNVICPQMLEMFANTTKDNDKFKSEEDIIKYLIDDDFVDEYLDLFHKYNNDEVVVWGYRELFANNIFSIIDGKKEKEIQVFKKRKKK